MSFLESACINICVCTLPRPVTGGVERELSRYGSGGFPGRTGDPDYPSGGGGGGGTGGRAGGIPSYGTLRPEEPEWS